MTLHLETPAELPAILADRRSMEEIFTNLVCNAINYSPDGGRVTVATVSPWRLPGGAGAGYRHRHRR